MLIPLIASKSSTRRNGPLFTRKFTIAAAVLGPIPGTNCNCSTLAEFKSRAFAGGAFFCATAALQQSRITATARADDSRLNAIALRIVLRDFTKERGLICNLRAIPNQNDLRVG